jgi:hypothetical protein
MNPYLCHPDWDSFKFCTDSGCYPDTKSVSLALNYAAYRVLFLLFNDTNQRIRLDNFMKQNLSIDPISDSFDPSTAIGIGNIIGRDAYIDRINDGANADGSNLGSTNSNPFYSDWTDWKATNPPMQEVNRVGDCSLIDRNHYQPLKVDYGYGPTVLYWSFAQWSVVRTFVKNYPFPVEQPYKLGTYQEQDYINDYTLLLQEYGTLDDYKKSLAHYFGTGRVKDYVSSWDVVVPIQIGIDVSRNTDLNYSKTIELFFGLFNILNDGSKNEYSNKRFYNHIRPTSAMQCLFSGQTIESWAGPYQGIKSIPGQNWTAWYPYGLVNNPTPEFPCGHCIHFASTMFFMEKYFKTPYFLGTNVTIAEGTSFAERKISSGNTGYIPGVTDVPNTGPFSIGYAPASDIKLQWTTWDDIITDAGLSRIYLGAHTYHSYQVGRKLGTLVGTEVSKKVYKLFEGKQECKNIGE